MQNRLQNLEYVLCKIETLNTPICHNDLTVFYQLRYYTNEVVFQAVYAFFTM